jgi:hypothetical protein
MKMEAVRSSETQVNFQWNAKCNILGDITILWLFYRDRKPDSLYLTGNTLSPLQSPTG